jgi:hypothetical protein
MRTKTLLLSAAVLAAGLAASTAQSVYSVNAVGYVNVVVTNGYNLLANPLNGTNNNINTVIPVAPADSLVIRWSNQQQRFVSTDTYLSGTGDPGVPDGWYDLGAGVASTSVLAPGEAFFFRKPGAGTATLTFVGEVPQGNLTNTIGTLYGFYSSIVPQQASLQTMGFPGRSDMTYQEWLPGPQRYGTVWTYLANTGDPGVPDGWYDIGAGVPVNPTPAVGQGFLLFNPTANGPQNWGRTFSVN